MRPIEFMARFSSAYPLHRSALCGDSTVIREYVSCGYESIEKQIDNDEGKKAIIRLLKE